MNDTVSFVEELPYKLRIELASRIHKKILAAVNFFKDKPKDFIAFIGHRLRPIRIKRGQYIYKQGEPAIEIYFLTSGEAAFVLP